MSKHSDALAFIDEAIDALSVTSFSGSGDGDWTPNASIESTIAIELERVDAAIGITGASMFAKLAERVKQAMIALHGAKQALEHRAS